MRHRDEAGFVRELARRGGISEDAQRRVMRALETSAHPLDIVFTELGILREDEFARAAGEIEGIEVRGDLEAHDRALAARIGEDFLERAGLLPLSADDAAVRVVAANPFPRTELRTLASISGFRSSYSRANEAGSPPRFALRTWKRWMRPTQTFLPTISTSTS